MRRHHRNPEARTLLPGKCRGKRNGQRSRQRNVLSTRAEWTVPLPVKYPDTIAGAVCRYTISDTVDNAGTVAVRYELRPSNRPATRARFHIRWIHRRRVKPHANLAGTWFRIRQFADFHDFRCCTVLFIPCCVQLSLRTYWRQRYEGMRDAAIA